MPFTEVQRALEAWRIALRDAEDAEPGSPQQVDALERAERCRAEYQRSIVRAEHIVEELAAETDHVWEQARAGHQAED